jgi:G3E family GTPase
MRTPVTLVTGYLGAGKTTLLRNIISGSKGRRLAIVMNEFGKIPIDGKVVEGRGIRIAELSGGCVCCSLSGEFMAAIEELITLAKPEWIIVETTGVAEPSALAHDIAENMPKVRLDAIVTIVDADAITKSPAIGHTGEEQIELADLLLLNKKDLVSEKELGAALGRVAGMNRRAMVLQCAHCEVPMEAVFGVGRETKIVPKHEEHQPDFDYFDFVYRGAFGHEEFMAFLDSLPKEVYRSKGFVITEKGKFLMNHVAGRHTLEPFSCDWTVLVFVGTGIRKHEKGIREALNRLKRV